MGKISFNKKYFIKLMKMFKLSNEGLCLLLKEKHDIEIQEATLKGYRSKSRDSAPQIGTLMAFSQIFSTSIESFFEEESHDNVEISHNTSNEIKYANKIEQLQKELLQKNKEVAVLTSKLRDINNISTLVKW